MFASEAERQFYLGVAGVRLWYAREALPGAAPSPVYDFGEEQGDRAADLPELVEPGARPKAGAAPVMPVAPGDTGGKPDLRSLMGAAEPPGSVPAADTSAPPVAKAAVVVPETVEAEATADDGIALNPPPQLNMRIWSGDAFTLIAGISAEASLRLQETLAVNILRSLAELSPRAVGQVSWPLFNNYRVPGNSQEDLRSVMAQVLPDAPARKLVVIGVEPGAEGGGFIPWLDQEPEVMFRHTLAELAADGNLKRSLWQLLKPLVHG